MYLSVRTLGTVEVSYEGSPVPELSTRKPRALLTYLAMHAGESVSREKIAGILWGDHEEELARTNLRQCLSVLRRAINHKKTPIIQNADGQALIADPDKISLDVRQFEQLSESTKTPDLRMAIETYRGPFLEGFSLNEPEFELWAQTERQRLKIRYNQVLKKLLDIANNENDNHQIIEIGTRLLLTEPYDESVQQNVIKSYLNTGQITAAQVQYNRFKDLLQSDLGIEPAPETRHLIEQYNNQKITLSAERRDAELHSHGPVQVLTDKVSPQTLSTSTADNTLSSPKMDVVKEKHRVQRTIALGLVALISAITAHHFFISSDSNNTVAGIANKEQQKAQPTASSDTVNRPENPPKIAILPLRNINDNDSLNYFSDGLTEDLITDLSRVSGLTVLSSSTSFAYKDSTESAATIASQLNVDYLLLGSVQREGQQVRISMRLVDAKTDTYHWTGRYDHHLQDIFQIQDQVVQELVDSLSVTLTESEYAMITETTVVNPEAYDLLLQGLGPLREFSVAGIEKSRQLFLKALEIEPNYARARANLALGYGREVVFRLANYQADLIKKGLREAQITEDLDNTIPQTEFARGVLYLADRNHHAAVHASQRAIELDPEYADGFALLAQTTAYSGLLKKALEAIRRAKSLNPKYPFSYLWVEGHILYLQHRFEEALPLLEESNDRNPTFLLGLLTLTATYAQLDQFEDADWINQEILSLIPDFSSHQEGINAPYKFAKHLELYIDGLLKAGLPD